MGEERHLWYLKRIEYVGESDSANVIYKMEK
jgi:hypothetical protein